MSCHFPLCSIPHIKHEKKHVARAIHYSSECIKEGGNFWETKPPSLERVRDDDRLNQVKPENE